MAVKGGGKFTKVIQSIGVAARNARKVKVGFFAGSAYEDGTPVAMVAAIQEYGAPRANIPSRPFFRTMIARKSPEWPRAIANLLVDNNYDARETLKQVGEAISGQLTDSINQFEGVPLKPATIKRKGFAKQLIDTSRMVKSVGYEVE